MRKPKLTTPRPIDNKRPPSLHILPAKQSLPISNSLSFPTEAVSTTSPASSFRGAIYRDFQFLRKQLESTARPSPSTQRAQGNQSERFRSNPYSPYIDLCMRRNLSLHPLFKSTATTAQPTVLSSPLRLRVKASSNQAQSPHLVQLSTPYSTSIDTTHTLRPWTTLDETLYPQ